MTRFPCTRCGTSLDPPPPGRPAACPRCGQVFETPDASRPQGPPPRRDPAHRDLGGYGRGEDPFDRVEKLPHSGLGVASFLIGALVIVIDLLFVVLALVAGQSDSAVVFGRLAVIFNCLGAVTALVGLGLGVPALFQEERNRTFAVLGVGANGLVLLAVTGLFLWLNAVGKGPFF
jgi:hypothetical protein